MPNEVTIVGGVIHDIFYAPILRIREAQKRNLEKNKALDDTIDFFNHLVGRIAVPDLEHASEGWMQWDLVFNKRLSVGFTRERYAVYSFDYTGHQKVLLEVSQANYNEEVREKFIEKIKEVITQSEESLDGSF